MEAIKISVEVSVNLSENTQRFIESLFGRQNEPLKVTPAPATTPAPVATPAPATTPAPVATPAPATTPAPAAPAEKQASSSKTIEDVRKMLGQKVNEHRDAIKQKLNEFGAPSVTKLDPAKYNDMYDFLASL